ncbi:MAG: DUF6282 family protein [Acidobacteriota bacterium]
MEGAVDLHVHSAPDVDVRRFNDIELAREAARARMSAILIKSHQNSTVERAWLVSQWIPEVRVFGGLVLNETVGGLNPAAVQLAVKMGAKQVWMPTRSARNHRRYEGLPGGISVVDEHGRLLRVAEEILQILAGSGCILGTGHLSQAETFALTDRACALGGVRVLVTHPEWAPTFYSVEQQKALAAHGNVMFERCFVSTTHRCGFVPFETIERAIMDTGVEHTVLSTDLGQPDTPPPVEGLRRYAERLRSTGFSVEDVRQMMQANPARLLGEKTDDHHPT